MTDNKLTVNLIEEAKKGNLSAFSSLVKSHQEKSVRVAYSVLGNWEDARDVAQEAFVKAHDNLKKFEGKSGFSTWLYRIVVNLCKDQIRKKSTAKRFAFFAAEGPDEKGENPVLSDKLDEFMDEGRHAEDAHRLIVLSVGFKDTQGLVF